MNAKNLFLPDFSFFSSASYPFTPLVNGSIAGIINPKFNAYFVIPSLSVSIKENLAISCTAQLFRFWGSLASSANTNYIFVRLKQNF